jgi:hypothetical protein
MSGCGATTNISTSTSTSTSKMKGGKPRSISQLEPLPFAKKSPFFQRNALKERVRRKQSIQRKARPEETKYPKEKKEEETRSVVFDTRVSEGNKVVFDTRFPSDTLQRSVSAGLRPARSASVGNEVVFDTRFSAGLWPNEVSEGKKRRNEEEWQNESENEEDFDHRMISNGQRPGFNAERWGWGPNIKEQKERHINSMYNFINGYGN